MDTTVTSAPPVDPMLATVTLAPLSVSLEEILFWTIVIILSAILAYIVYRAMERPRLRLTQTPDGPRAMRRDVILYAITIPLLIFAWWNFFSAILIVADTNLEIVALTTVPAGIVLAARVLAHVDQRIAHEIAKAVPLTIITLIVVTGSLRGEENIVRLLAEAGRVDISWGALLFVLLADYAITAIWYWGYIRWWQPRREARRASLDTAPEPPEPANATA